MDSQQPTPKPRRYRWPWFLLAALILGVLLTVAWVLGAIRRVERIRESTRQNAAVPAATHVRQATVNSSSRTNGMVWIPAGTFSMGSDDGQPDERPIHDVSVQGFWMDATEVTNEKFEEFAQATGYVTVAEQKPDAKLYPQVPPDKLVAGSIVFKPPAGEVSLENHYI